MIPRIRRIQVRNYKSLAPRLPLEKSYPFFIRARALLPTEVDVKSIAATARRCACSHFADERIDGPPAEQAVPVGGVVPATLFGLHGEPEGACQS